MTAKEKRLIEDRRLGLVWAQLYFALDRRNCSAWEWFVMKSSGNTRAARRRWEAADVDALIRANVARPPA